MQKASSAHTWLKLKWIAKTGQQSGWGNVASKRLNHDEYKKAQRLHVGVQSQCGAWGVARLPRPLMRFAQDHGLHTVQVYEWKKEIHATNARLQAWPEPLFIKIVSLHLSLRSSCYSKQLTRSSPVTPSTVTARWWWTRGVWTQGQSQAGVAPTSFMKPKCSLNWHQVCLVLGGYFGDNFL